MKRFLKLETLLILLFLLAFSTSVFSQQPRIAGTALTNGPRNGGSIFFHDLPAVNPSPIYYFDNVTPDQAITKVTRGNLDWIYGTLQFNGTNGSGCLFRIKPNGTQFEKLSDLNLNQAANTTPYFHTDNVVYYASQNGMRKFNTINLTHSLLNVPNSVYAHHLVIDNSDWIYYTTQSGIEKVRTDGSFHQSMYTFGAPDGSGGIEGLIEIPGDSLIGVHPFGGSNNSGTIYSIKKDGTGFTVLHEFDLAFGATPMSRPFYFDGKLFGTTSIGGVNSNGVVYCMNPDGTNYRVIRDIPAGTGLSSLPGGSVHVASNGRLFGAFQGYFQDDLTFTQYLMFKMDTSGENFEVFLQRGTQREHGDYSLGAYLEDDEQMYIITSRAGRHDGGVLLSYDTLGIGSDVYHFGFSERGYYPNRLIKGSDGLLYGTNTIGGNDGNGIIYSVDETGDDFLLLNEFTDADGYEPRGKLLEGSDGMLYGVLHSGGTNFTGAIYRMNKTGSVFEIIYSPTGADGTQMNGDLIEVNGALYGTSLYGGLSGSGVVFRVNKDGTNYTILKSFNVTPAIAHPSSGVIYHNGYLYGSSGNGGTNFMGGIYRLQLDGSGYEELHSFSGADGAHSFQTPVIANNGFLYGTTQQGGTTGQGVLFRMELDGDNYTVLRNFDFDIHGWIPNGLIQASDGNLYGTTAANVAVGGTGSETGGTIYRVALDGTGFTTLFRSNIDALGGNLDGLMDYTLSNVLPVELLTFSGRSNADGIQLSWKTVTEINSDHFELERSTDGVSFQRIASVQAAGNSQTLKTYSHLDRNPFNGVNYYRLKIVDIDGSFEYSRIIRVDLHQKELLTVYPNPATNFINISGISANAKEIRILDASGRMMLRKMLAPDTSNEQLDISSLSKGSYVIYVYGDQMMTSRFIKK